MLHCICCDMTAPRQRGHKHNPRSNLFGSFIVGHNSYPRSSRDGRLYLVSSRSCGNAALIQHTAHGVSGLKEYNCDCVVSPWFSSSALGLLCRLCRLQLILLRYNSLTVHPPFSPSQVLSKDGAGTGAAIAAMLVSIQYTESTFTAALIGARS